MRALTRILSIVAGTALALSGAGLALASQQSDSDADAPTIVEDYTYPGAAQVLAQRGITIVSGDGHLTRVACGATDLIEVRSAGVPADLDADPGHYCFKVNGTRGSLTLTIPNAYQVKGDNHVVTATITVDSATSTVPITKNTWTGIGLGAGPDPATLLELDATS